MDLILVLQNENFYKLSSSKCVERLTSYILDNHSVYKQSKDSALQIKCVLKVFVSKLLKRWKESNWKMERLTKYNSAWLKNDLVLPAPVSNASNSQSSKGRPSKSFEEGSVRTKRRRVQPIVAKTTPELLCAAAQASLTKSGKRTAAQMVNLALTTSPRRYKRIKKIHDAPKTSGITPYSPEEALAFIIDSDMGKEDYIHMQRGAKSRGANIYPAYNVIAQTKKQCYPNNIKISETEVQIPVQDILDHTIHRLADVQKDVLHIHHDHEENLPIEVVYKWGLDGSGGHSIYKQCFANNSLYGDTNIILCTIVPLQMSENTKTNGKQIIWQNPSPSSSRYNRVIRMQIEKETKESVKLHYNEIEEQISRLQVTKVTLGDKTYNFKHHAICTMMDGKTCNVLTDTSSTQACNICKATPKDLNNIDLLLRKQYSKAPFQFGISVLHSYLRCYEYLLHISYKMDLQKWQARGNEAKESMKKRKIEITERFYKEMGLVVDQPKQGGGNSNDGNTARKFFAEPEKSSDITGIDTEIIKRFANILSVLSCGFNVNHESFKKYSIDTAKMCINTYDWYKMSASVHKLLIHGADIIKELPLPVGLFSEDVLETSQKEFKSVRLFHTRKTSRIHTNTDIAHWMLIASDPIIASKRRRHNKKKKPFAKEVLEMLENPFIENVINRNDDDESEDDDHDHDDHPDD